MTTTILANAGVPMLAVQMPLLVMALPVVIAVEACLARRWLRVPWAAAWGWTAVANLVSTLVGFPIAWVACVLAQEFVGGGGVPNLPEPWFSVYTVTVQAPWLLPLEERLRWMVPTAGIVLLVPAFFASVWIEGWIYRRVLAPDAGAPSVRAATWRMHLVTYALLLAAGLCLLGAAL